MNRRATRRRLAGGLAVAAASALALPATAGPVGAATTPGVTGSSVHIGVWTLDLQSVASLTHGLSLGNLQGAYGALIKNVNAHGGIDGRKIVATYVSVDPIEESAADAACTQLVEDDHVFAVVGEFNGEQQQCVVANPTTPTPVVGGTMTDQLLAQAKSTWVTTSPNTDVLQPAVAAAAARAGVFKGKTVGVLESSNDPAGSDAKVVAALEKEGVKPKVTATVEDDASDTEATYQQVSGVIAPKFQSAGVNVVVATGSGSLVWIDAGGGGADYHPRLVATEYSVLSSGVSGGSSASAAVVNNAVTASTKPLALGTTSLGWSDPELQRCAKVIRAAGIHFSSPVGQASDSKDESYMSVSQSCQTMALFTALLEKAGKKLTTASLGTAADSLGAVEVPGLGTATYARATPAGAFPLYLYRWNAAKAQWSVSGSSYGTT